MGDATSLLVKWNSGDAEAREALVNQLYTQLTAIAGHHLAGERQITELQPAALVNEAYMRLIDMKNTLVATIPPSRNIELPVPITECPSRLLRDARPTHKP